MVDQTLILTSGKGIRSLKKYFDTFHEEFPRRFPTRTQDWKDDSMYDAPDGFLYVWSDGSWTASFSLSSLASHQDEVPDPKKLAEAIRQAIPSVTVRIET